MARIISTLVKEAQHQNNRVSLLEDRMKDQDDKIRKKKEEGQLEVKRTGDETIQLLRNQLEEFESASNATHDSNPSNFIVINLEIKN